MALVALHGVSIQYGGPLVLDPVSLNIAAGDRACVTGRNGEGKSTLLKVIAGVIEPDAGEVLREAGLRVAYLSQDVPGDQPGSVLEVAERGLDTSDGAHRSAKPFLTRLGLDPAAVFNTLSGGLRRRALLAGALASEPQLLLLDEPTNHLDISTIEWLEGFLAKSTCACLFVTHDRTFLKHVAKKVLDLDRGHLAGWDCDYPTFLRRKADLISDEQVYWEKKTKKLNQEEAWLVRGVKARTTRNEGRVAALMKLREEFRQRRTAVGTSKMQLDNLRQELPGPPETRGSSEALSRSASPIKCTPTEARPSFRAGRTSDPSGRQRRPSRVFYPARRRARRTRKPSPLWAMWTS